MAMKQQLASIYERHESAFSGACLVKSGSEVLLARASGLANRDYGVPNQLCTRFDTASVTKTFTAVATLQLVGRGLLQLGDRIHDVIDLNGTAIPADVTVEQLLNHTSGIADDADEEAGEEYAALFVDRPNYSVRDCVDFLPQFAYKKPMFRAGTDVRYNNCAFVLLGLALEKLAGTDYRSYVTEHIFGPAGMTNTFFGAKDEVCPNTAQGYFAVRDGSGNVIKWKKNIYSYPPIGTPDAGALTTVEDLDVFVRALKSGTLLSPEHSASIFEPHCEFTRPRRFGLRRTGYAFEFIEADGRVFCMYKEGGNPGVDALFSYYPALDISLNMLSNTNGPLWKMHSDMQAVLFAGQLHLHGSADRIRAVLEGGETMNPGTTIGAFFSELEDPRTGPAVLHEFFDIVAIGILAFIAGADNWVDVELYARSKEPWLKGFLSLQNGIPSHDTFGRVFSMINADAFAECFARWTHAMAVLTQGQVIAIDGKSVRRSHDRGREQRPLHVVSAWASANHLVLGQVAVQDKSNEITAIPELLEMLDVSNKIVTIDAMGCQREIARRIMRQGGDYLLALKQNQSLLLERVGTMFAPVRQGLAADVPTSMCRRSEKNHGRLETRSCWAIDISDWRYYVDPEEKWPGLSTVVMVKREREIADEKSTEYQYYITSLPCDAEQILVATRAHWSIENSLHWVLDIAFREDESRVRADAGQLILSLLRRLALNVLRQDKTTRSSIKAKRKKAAWDNDYLTSLLSLPLSA